MENEQNIVRHTLAELIEMNARGESHQTDWTRLDAMTEEELEASIDWEVEGEFDLNKGYAHRFPAVTRRVSVLLDGTTVAWFKCHGCHGDDYLARIRFVLRDYADAQMLKRANERLVHRRAS